MAIYLLQEVEIGLEVLNKRNVTFNAKKCPKTKLAQRSQGLSNTNFKFKDFQGLEILFSNSRTFKDIHTYCTGHSGYRSAIAF